MKRRAFFSLVVFALGASYMLFGALTQLLQGVLEWKDAGFFLGMSLGMGAFFAVTLYAVLSFVARRRSPEQGKEEPYRPSRWVTIALAALLISTIGYSIRMSYRVGAEQKVELAKQRQAAEQRKLAIQKAAEAEQARRAALTPEQRAAEERQNQERQAAATKAAADRLAKEQADRAAEVEKKRRRDAQLRLAGLGALQLKRAMKDPEAFELKSVYVATNGTACYEYRAKNTFGAIFPGQAVMTPKGRFFLRESDATRFANVWNADCTKSGGDDITSLVKGLAILDR